MVRPCYLVIDPEHSASISTRKLVIESAKLNVITAYSGGEALEAIAKYPAVDGVVCNSELHDMSVPHLVTAIKKISPHMAIIIVGQPLFPDVADFHVRSYDPAHLLEVLERLNAEKAQALDRHEEELRRREESDITE